MKQTKKKWIKIYSLIFNCAGKCFARQQQKTVAAKYKNLIIIGYYCY